MTRPSPASCICSEETSIDIQSVRRRHQTPPLLPLLIGFLMLFSTSSAFLSPRSTQTAYSKSPHTDTLPQFSSRQALLKTRGRGRLRQQPTTFSSLKSQKLHVLLAPDQSLTAHTENSTQDVNMDVNPTEQTNATKPQLSLSTEADTPSNANSTSSSPAEVIIPYGETEERHMERTRMGDDVEELTHLLAHDEKDIQQLMKASTPQTSEVVSPSVPISYDEHGMVQADAISYLPAMVLTAAAQNEYALQVNGANGASAVVALNESDYPYLIKLLFQKDANGQTIASKLFNLTLLAVSFGYVVFSVFNIDKGMTRGWTPGEIGMRIPLDTWASYENSLSEKPVATKTIINIVIYLLGDWLSQTLFQKKNVLDFDAARTLKNGFVGMCFGPAVHEYYEFSDWILPVDGVTLGITNRAFKILMDQTIYLSIKCSIYIMAIGVLNGDTVGNASQNVKNRIKPIMFTAWKFWPLVHCVTYGLIPARHRILWVNSVDLVWNAILASKARDDDGGDDGDAKEGSTKGAKQLEGGNTTNEGLDLSNMMKVFNFGQEESVHVESTGELQGEIKMAKDIEGLDLKTIMMETGDGQQLPALETLSGDSDVDVGNDEDDGHIIGAHESDIAKVKSEAKVSAATKK